MSYTSYLFVLFVFITACAYYVVHKESQWVVLLVSSIIFYMCSGPAFLLYILAVSLVTWYGAKRMKQKNQGKKFLLVTLIFLNIGILLIVKWSGMGFALINRVLEISVAWKLILPLGMSFFTFQNTSYLLDVYREKIQAENNFWHYLLYAAYFPYIVSGPINRYEKMSKQFCEIHFFRRDVCYQGVLRIVWGYIKKMVIADRAAVFVDEIFDHYFMYRGLFILFAVILFSLQLYMDFSGCMDIVMGISKIFGIDMTENFHMPYGALTTAEFWKGWHISLTSWLQDYLYIPLGGNRKGKCRKYFNTVVVFVFSGMWHGAGVTFLIWGGLNAFFIVFGDATKNLRRNICGFIGLDEDSYGAKFRKRITTIILIEFSWLFFRANGFREAFMMLRRIFVGWNPWILFDGSLYQAGLDRWDFVILIVGACFAGWISHMQKHKNLHRLFLAQSWLCQAMIILCSLVIWCLFGVYGPGYDPVDFLYYNF